MNSIFIKFALFTTFLLTLFSVKAQNNVNQSKPVLKSTSVPIANKSDFVSDYMGYEKTIKVRSISGEIPAGLPKYKTGQSKEEYVTILKKWGKNNLHFIKKEYHAEILAPNKSKNAMGK